MLAASSHEHIAIAGRLGSGPALGPKSLQRIGIIRVFAGPDLPTP